jgi:hypothetical protein
VLGRLVTADTLLAEAAIAAGSSDDKEIAKAQDEMAKAADELEKGFPDKAIEHFKNAWLHAVKA